MQNKTLTIMFVDMQGYTSATSQQTREEQQLLIKEMSLFVQKHVTAKSGNLVKTMGDGFLITFESPTNAINCGLAMQEELKRRNASILNENNFISLRIGISTGEVSIDEHNDVYGEAVNIASRIEKLCEPNEVFISESTYLAMNKSEVNARDLGPQKLKNILEEVRIYKILKNKTTGRPVQKKQYLRGNYKLVIIIVGILLILFLLVLIIDKIKAPSIKPPMPVRENTGNERTQRIKLLEDVRVNCAADINRVCANIPQQSTRLIVRCLGSRINEVSDDCRVSLDTLQRAFPPPQ